MTMVNCTFCGQYIHISCTHEIEGLSKAYVCEDCLRSWLEEINRWHVQFWLLNHDYDVEWIPEHLSKIRVRCVVHE